MSISDWLTQHGFSRYISTFEEQSIGTDVLGDLSDEDLLSLGIPLGDRKRLLRTIRSSSAAIVQRKPEPKGEAERRQVTVLFADLVGYTKLSSRFDAESIQDLLNRFFALTDDIVRSCGGTVDKHIGDCIMAVFGAPIAHEDDPLRAARAALSIRKSVQTIEAPDGVPLRVHVGLASGTVVASDVGSDVHRHYTVTGDSVNLASRLAHQAVANEILTSGEVMEFLDRRVIAEEAGEHAIRGLTGQVQVWRLLELAQGVVTAAGRPLVGRQMEIRKFKTLLKTCFDTGRGATLVIRGEAGIGKSRLAAEMCVLAQQSGLICHTASFYDFGSGQGRDAIHSLALGLADLRNEDTVDGRPAPCEQLSRYPSLEEHRLALSILLDVPLKPEDQPIFDSLDAKGWKAAQTAAMGALVRAACASTPRLLFVEDAHWADSGAMEQLTGLALAAAELPLLILCTTRLEGNPFDTAWMETMGGLAVPTLDLGRLSVAELRQLAAAIPARDGDLVERCVERAGGNPLFLDQLLRFTGEATDAVPATLQSLVQARVDRLAPSQKSAIQSASVLGARFYAEDLRALLTDPNYTLNTLIEQQFLTISGGDCAFTHALIRDAVYESLSRTRRRELHGRAAMVFADRDVVLYAQHLDRACDARAGAAYHEAARAQARAFRYQEALGLAERGCALADKRSDQWRLVCLIGELRQDCGAIAQSIEAYQTALTLSAGAGEECSTRLGLAAAMRIGDRLDDAFEQLAVAQRKGEEAQHLAELSRVHHMRGNILFPRGEIEACVDEHEQALEIARQAGAVEEEARALGGLGDAFYVKGRLLTARSCFAQCCEVARDHGFIRIEAANWPMLAFSSLFALELDRTLAEARGAIDLARRTVQHRAEAIAHDSACWAHLTRAEPHHAFEHAEAAQRATLLAGAHRFEAENLILMAESAHLKGDSARARDFADRALARSRETGIDFIGPVVFAISALVSVDQKFRHAAIGEAEDLIRNGGLSHNVLFVRRYAIEVMLEDGNLEEAERHAEALRAYTASEPLPWADFVICRAHALISFRRCRRDNSLRFELARLADIAATAGIATFEPALRSALADLAN